MACALRSTSLRAASPSGSKVCKRGHTGGRYKSGGCKQCVRENALAWGAAHPEKLRQYGRKWRTANIEQARELSRKSARKWWETKRIALAGRPRPDRCECCGRPSKKPLFFDHDHAAGHFRGWICGPCNTAIGALGDSIAGVEKALRYLKAAKSLT